VRLFDIVEILGLLRQLAVYECLLPLDEPPAVLGVRLGIVLFLLGQE